MFLSSRRTFLATSLATLAAGLVRADSPSDPVLPKAIDDAPFQPNTLFLTWQRDPTTTMTVQWLGASGETSDTNIRYKTLKPTTGKRSRPPPSSNREPT